jgi:hypothetical protein
MYPEANIWIAGHSLGGSVASLLGTTFGVPVVAFEAPGEKMAASRLHLPSPVSPLKYLRCIVFKTHRRSLPHNMSLTCITLPILSQWVTALVSPLYVQWGDMQWSRGLFLLSFFVLFSHSNGCMMVSSRCHLGEVILYDTVAKFGWSPDSRTHSIQAVIEKVLNEDWELPDGNGQGGREVPIIETEHDCMVSILLGSTKYI